MSDDREAILITGGAGFIGTNVADRLLSTSASPARSALAASSVASRAAALTAVKLA